ncbi:MAG: FAD-binding oxidoreductase [Rhodovarius sp.]|nr:FAD-binding oxidoreductase [Rhodovarius sp.]MDW8314934.1 FAD-binding oxidoreductase [Rhodovarius sp.]
MAERDIAGLIAALPGIAWTTEEALLRQKSRDFFWYSPVLKRLLAGVKADAIATPREEAEVIAILAECARRRIPVTPRGAGTGNYGQAMPLAGGVVLDLSAMDRPLWARGWVLRAQAGAKLIDLDAYAQREVGGELRFHPSTRRTATIGGFIAGGSSGIGSVTWGTLREPGNILGLRVVTMEEQPRVLELRGAEIQKVNHAYGTNGVITEVEVPLAPAQDWYDLVVGFATFADAARFADALASCDGIVKKLVSVLAAPVPQRYFRAYDGLIPEGVHVVLAMVAAPFLDFLAPLLARHGGRELHRIRTAEATVPAYEHSWNHTTLQALKVDRSITYLQTLFPAPGHVALAERMQAMFGDEVPMHLEFVRFGGQVLCFGLQLVRFTSEERLNEIIAIHEAHGAPIFNPHAYTLEEGGMKHVDRDQLAFKRETDPMGLLNPGKMLAFEDPEWTPAKPRTHYIFGEPAPIEEVLE